MMTFFKKIKIYFQEQLNIDIKYFLSGGFFLSLSQIITVAASLISTVVLTNLLTENDYGFYRYIIGLAVFLTAFSLTGLPHAVLQAAARGHTGLLKLSIFKSLKYSIGITVAALATSLYYYLNSDINLALGCLIIAFLQPLTNLYSNTLFYTFGVSDFKKSSIMQSVKSIFVSFAVIFSAYFSNNVVWIVLSFFLSQTLISLIYLKISNKNIDSSVSSKIRDKYFSYAKNTSVRNILVKAATSLDSIIIFQLVGAKELALYSVSLIFTDQARATLKNLQTLLMPKFSKHDSVLTLKVVIYKKTTLILIVFTAIAISLAFALPLIYNLLFPKYASAAFYAQILTIGIPASIFLVPAGALRAQRLEKQLYIFDISTSLFQITTTLILLVWLGVLGAVISRVATQWFKAILAFGLLGYVKN